MNGSNLIEAAKWPYPPISFELSRLYKKKLVSCIGVGVDVGTDVYSDFFLQNEKLFFQ